MALKIYSKTKAESNEPLNGDDKRWLSKFKLLSLSLLFIHLVLMMHAAFNLVNAQTYAPMSYWTFNSSPFNKDSMNRTNMDFTSYGCGYTVSNNSVVGKGLILGSSGDNINSGNFAVDTAFTIEFLFKPGYQFNQTLLFRRMDGGFSANFNFDGIYFYTYTNGTGSDEMKVPFDQIGKRSYGYYIDGNWHHLVFKYSSNTGKKEIYIDGECPSGYSKSISGKIISGSNTSLFWNQGVSYMKYFGEYDEIAIYNRSIPEKLIYQHYKDAINNHLPYSFNLTYSGSLPSATPITAALDPMDFPQGYLSPTTSALEQLRNYPTARYKPGNTLMKNFNWVDLMYMGGRFQPGVSDAQSVTNSVNLNEELAKNWNYMIQLRLSMDSWGNAWANLANQNPQLGTSLITLRAQLNPSTITSQSLSNDKYLQNSSGSFIDPNGNGSSHKWWRPTAPTSTYDNDGVQMRANVQDVLNALTRPLTMINENGEVFPWITDGALAADPAVVAAKNASGMDFQTFQASKFKENEIQSYRDKIFDLTALSNTKFTEYGIDGFPQYRQKYSQARLVNSQMNGQYYSTPDFYPRWPYNWRNWITAWHGWQWIVDSRYNELQVGDNLFSPFVAAGWDVDETKNMRPGQFLGLLKCLNMVGAEFFYTGYFNEAGNYNPPNPPPGNPAGYAWQTAAPSYAQGIASRYEDLLRNGSVLPGNVPAYYSDPNGKPGYTFWAGDLRKLVVVRKHNTQSKFAITGTIQPNTNMQGGAENESVATITLDGQQLKFNVRRQGSTYIYDKTNAANPVFYQLDAWHESSHPSHWSKDFVVEAELYDNTNATYNLKTIQAPGAAAGDYTDYTTAVVFPSGQSNFTPMEYEIQPRSTSQSNLYLWVRVRSTDGTATGVSVSLDNGSAKTIGCVADTNWTWYRIDACDQQPIEFTGISVGQHTIRFTPTNNKLMFDKFVLSSNSSLITNYSTATCSSGGSASATANGATSFCQGGSVTLTASAGTSYLWSNGATTQSITVTSSGNYNVTVSQSGGCAAVSNTVNVSVSTAPAATITPSGSTSICPGSSVTLTASTGSNYLWSNGATTQSITVNTAGGYSVTVSNAQGCSATSSPVSVTMSTGSVPTISANGPTTFCQGSNVTLTASTGSSYLWSNGATTKSITVSSSGTFSVTVTSGTCSGTSAPKTVTVNSLPNATITANGPTTFCAGGSVVLTSSTGNSYLWSNGATTKSITVTTAGSYFVTVSNSSCSATSASKVITVNSTPTATITANGPTSFCPGGSVTLTASTGSSYLWSNGKTTKSITVTTAGSYSVTVSNGSCSATSAPTVVTVTNNPTATITANGPTSFCPGGSVTLTASTGSSYLWSNGKTTKSITVTTAGSYSVTVSNGSCSATSAPTVVTVTNNPTATITASGATTFCAGGSVTLTASTGSSYLWSNGKTTKSITVSTAGSYSVTVSNGSCSATSAPTVVTITNNPTATITASGATTFCAGGSVTLTASTGSSYLWSNGKTTKSITVTTAGSYSVTVSNGSCSATSAPTVVTVTNNPTATITASGATTFCAGGSVTLTASTGSSYLWSNGKTTKSITVSTAGSYSVTVSNGSCSATSAPTVVTVTNNPTATITASGATTFCAGGSVTLTASNGSSYLWSNGKTTKSITVSTAGSYSVTVSNGSCSATSTPTVVSVNSIPTATITVSGSTNLTQGQTVTLTASSASSYLWSNGATTQSITVSAAGSYYVTVTSAAGCSDVSSAVTVTVSNAPQPASITSTAVNNTICSGQSVSLTASSGLQYIWLPGLQATQSINVTAAGTYTVNIKNADGSTSTANITLTQAPSPNMPEITYTYQPSLSYQLKAFEPSAVSYLWNGGQTTSVVIVSAPGSYTVKAVNSYGCQSAANTIKVNSLNNSNCGKPDMLTEYNVLNNKATLMWNPAVKADSFKVAYSILGANSFRYKYVRNAHEVTINELQPCTDYEWNVTTICAGGSVVSGTERFQTLCSSTGCGSTVINTSSNNITTTSAQLNWYGTTANNITIRYKKLGAPSYSYQNIASNNTTAWGYNLTGLSPNTTYQWSVMTVCGTISSNYSQDNYFTTLAGCMQVENPAVVNVQTNKAVVTWTPTSQVSYVLIRYAVKGTTRYKYRYANASTGSVVIAHLHPGTQYVVQVRSMCSYNSYSAYSSDIIFTTGVGRLADEGSAMLLNAYPNPATEYITYAFQTEKEHLYEVRVCDMSGRELYKQKQEGQIGINSGNIDVRQFTPGMYLIIIKQGGVENHLRFQVNR
ncbi:MAG: fibronectin type III domain-containing protein [Bacteroidetes bacterium]|nr:fibronectin type III domain-containing protein [Bacteroidota bacterium]